MKVMKVESRGLNEVNAVNANVAVVENREFKIRRLRTTTTVKRATAHDQNQVTVYFSHVVLRLR